MRDREFSVVVASTPLVPRASSSRVVINILCVLPVSHYAVPISLLHLRLRGDSACEIGISSSRCDGGAGGEIVVGEGTQLRCRCSMVEVGGTVAATVSRHVGIVVRTGVERRCDGSAAGKRVVVVADSGRLPVDRLHAILE